MQLFTKEQARKLEDFISNSKRKYLFYHRDQDGVCSAALFVKFFPGFKTVTKKGPRINDNTMEFLMQKRPDLIVFLDLPVDQEREKLLLLQKEIPSLRIVIIDHHIYEKDMNSPSLLHVNPLFRKRDVYLSVSYIIYKTLRYLFGSKVKKSVWISVMGAIGDYDLKDSGDVLKECRELYPHLVGEEPLKSELANGAELISSTITIKNWKGAEKILKMLAEADSYEEFSNKKLLKQYKNKFDEEFTRIIESSELELHPEIGLRIYRITTEFSMVSAISNHLSEKYPDSVIIVRKVDDGEWKFSLRCQSGRVNTALLVKKAINGIGTGGGHPKASAGMTKEWEKFKKRFIRELSAS
jgi:single-stranded DNA-specific DHH superfamily exonuclease